MLFEGLNSKSVAEQSQILHLLNRAHLGSFVLPLLQQLLRLFAILSISGSEPTTMHLLISRAWRDTCMFIGRGEKK